jgi:pyruvate dehydrogenase E1 component beta subunit
MLYMSGGQLGCPIVFRGNDGAGGQLGSTHSWCVEGLYSNVPGVKIVIPSCPADAKGLMKTAIRDDDPVFFLEHKKMYDLADEVPDESYTVPFGEARITREGRDVTIVAVGRMVVFANQVADELKPKGISCTVVDPRTLSPLDRDTILEMVEETGRLVVVDEANPRCSFATDVAALAAEHAFDSLEAPVKLVTAPHTPVPYAPNLEEAYVPSVERITAAVKAVMGQA